MRSGEAKLSYPACDIDQDWYRLIPSRFPPIDPYERLGSATVRALAAESEALTNPRQASKARLTKGTASLDERSPRLQNWNHAPFTYKNPEGSHFLEPAYGVLEVAATVSAALAIAVHRREIFLSRTNEEAIDLDMRLLCTRIRGKFVDLTTLEPDTSQATRWAIGRELYEQGAKGVLFCRPQKPDAHFLAIFDGGLLERSVQETHYRFVWDGKAIKSVYDFNTGEEILRGDLLSDGASREAA
jgi:hypothetical protein